MALSEATLASGIEAMVPTDDEASAIQAFVDAWDAYFGGSSLGTGSAIPGSYAAGLTALQGALTGFSATGAAALAIQNGLTAFWAAIAPLAASIYVQTPPAVTVPPLTPPPGVAAVGAALTAQFAADTSSQADLATCAANMAAIIHANAGLGGLGLVQVAPAAPVPTPIL